MKIGYACINLTLDCSCSKTFRLASFNKSRFLAAVKNNLECLMKILEWNKAMGIYYFRISSGMIPFADHPVCKIKWQKIFKKDFQKIGGFIRQNKMRVTMHPDHFTILNSPRPEVVKKSFKTLLYHNDILDLMELDSNHKLQIHLGGVYNDREKSKTEFVKNYKKLPLKIRRRLVLENDDRCFPLKDCLDVSHMTGIPVVLDVFHHSLLNNGETVRQAMSAMIKTWKKSDGAPMIDFSSQDKIKKKGAHSYYVDKKSFQKFLSDTSNVDKDIILEAKGKDEALTRLANIVSTR